MSNKIRYQDNFFEAVNQAWIDATPLPEGYASWGSFEILEKKSVDDIKAIIKKLLTKADLTRENKFIVNLFKNYLNKEARKKDGISPILPILHKIDALSNKADLTKLFIELEQEHDTTFFHSKMVDADFKNSNVRALMIDSMGLGMSDRDFYEISHPRHQEIKQAYKIYVNDLVELANIEFASKDLFATIYQFEADLAKTMLKQEELRSPENIYNLMDIEQINQSFGFIDWKNFLTTLGYIKAEKMIVTEPVFFKELTKTIEQMDLTTLKDILKYKVLAGSASILTPELYAPGFKFSSVFSGVTEMQPEEDRAVRFVNALLGEILSKEYIKLHFSESAKEDVLAIVKDLFAKYKLRINNLAWMSGQTKQKAIEKVDSFKVKIGYPDQWEDFSDLSIRSYEEGGSLYENLLSISKHDAAKTIKEINLPVDKNKWYMHAQTVNAYYNPSSNEICFPAGILQKPFYDEKQSHAANLGGIGAVIGHEVSHGFDDEGSKFDKDGNLKDWWLPEDYAEYNLRTKAIIDQYDQYQINGSNVNGKLTCGENIGDLSGVAAALDICKEQAPNDLKAFFENYAFVWRRKSTAELINTRMLIDPHSPEIFRCNGVLVNIDEFHETYQTKPGDKMFKQKEARIKVW